jgi:hypothetical protein
MLRYPNITISATAIATLNVSPNSLFILYIDQGGDGEFEEEHLPYYWLTFNDFVLPDRDNDGINDFEDNCPEIVNPYQYDFNNNNKGDACDNPRYYKELVLHNIESADITDKKEHKRIALAEKHLQKSLNKDYWETEFKINTSKVFIYEFISLNKLAGSYDSSYLALADKLIVEKALEDNGQIITKKYNLAESFYQQGNNLYLNKKYDEAILYYMKAWIMLK